MFKMNCAATISESMDCIDVFNIYHAKLANLSLVTEIWKDIMSGRSVPQNNLIEFSLHLPVDLEVYFTNLHKRFKNTSDEAFKGIDGNLKAYVLSIFYYCFKSRVDINARLLAAELYLKILSSPGVGKLYYEENMLMITMCVVNNLMKDLDTCPVVLLRNILELNLSYIAKETVPFTIYEGTVNLLANVIKYHSRGHLKQCTDPLAVFALESIKELLQAKQSRLDIKTIFLSFLKFFSSDVQDKAYFQNEDEQAMAAAKEFIKSVVRADYFDKGKREFLLEALFDALQMPNFGFILQFVEVINELDKDLYNRFLLEISNSLEAEDEKIPHSLLIDLIYYLFDNPYPEEFTKVETAFMLCFRSIIFNFMHPDKDVSLQAIACLAKICWLPGNKMVDSIFETVNITGKFSNISIGSFLTALILILNNNDGGNTLRNQNIFKILAKMLTSLVRIDEDLPIKILYIIFKDGSPYSLKPLLPDMHSLYLKLFQKGSRPMSMNIIHILYKLAMHPDSNSSVYCEHIYRSAIFPSFIDGITYTPDIYSDVIFSEEFEYRLLLAKCRDLIRYEHINQLISTFDHNHPGYATLLNALLDYVEYKEYKILTVYLKRHFADVCCADASEHFFNAYRRILINKQVHSVTDYPKFNIIYEKIWTTLSDETCSIPTIRPAFELMEYFKYILQLPPNEERKEALLNVASDRAYQALTLNQFFYGSIMHLTEICIALRKAPHIEVLNIFDSIMNNNRTFRLMEICHKDVLIQLIALYGTLAMMDLDKIPIAIKMFKTCLQVLDPLLRLATIKMYSTLCLEVTHELEDVTEFCCVHALSDHNALSRVCLIIIEELIHNNYILLDSENFMLFVHRLGEYSYINFMRELLERRFVLSNKHDIGRFYLSTMVYMSGCTTLPEYPVSASFRDNLNTMRGFIDAPKEMITFLFNAIQVKTRFNILLETSLIYDNLIAGNCKVDNKFLTFLSYSQIMFKVMTRNKDTNYKDDFYENTCKSIHKQLLNNDPEYNEGSTYREFAMEIKKCTMTLLELLFFVQHEQRLEEYINPTFDVVIFWIDHVKPELVAQIRENAKCYDLKLNNLLILYRQRKTRFENYFNNQEEQQFRPLRNV